jgi:isopentenyl-diphosphate delta-isomerase
VATSNQDQLILVDGEDRALGTATRAACHAPGGQRHRAFSVYLFDGAGRLVVQRRQASKLLWPLYWSNSCCSHPRAGEDVATAARRRVQEELGVDVPLTPAFHYEYRADFGAVGTEHEVVHVFLGRVEEHDLVPNPDEVAELRMLTRVELEAELADPARTTPWFRIAWPRLTAEGWIDDAGPRACR